jgi:hypothetical protein
MHLLLQRWSHVAALRPVLIGSETVLLQVGLL